MIKCEILSKIMQKIRNQCIITARKRSLGQGNIFTPVCHSVHGGWHVWLLRGGAWLLWGGACVVALGGHAWFYSGVCAWFYSGGVWFYLGGHAWFYSGGGLRGFIRGVCMVLFGGGMRGFSDTMRYGQCVTESCYARCF